MIKFDMQTAIVAAIFLFVVVVVLGKQEYEGFDTSLSQYRYFLVNKREIVLNGNTANPPKSIGVGDTPTQLVFAYGPFSYGSGDNGFPLPSGAKKMYRVYAIYGDNVTKGNVKIQFDWGWGGTSEQKFEVSLPETWGGQFNQRDGYSDFFTDDDMKKAGVPNPQGHATLFAYTTQAGKVAGIHKVFIETWYVL